jgi:hypothetical protein
MHMLTEPHDYSSACYTGEAEYSYQINMKGCMMTNHRQILLYEMLGTHMFHFKRETHFYALMKMHLC